MVMLFLSVWLVEIEELHYIAKERYVFFEKQRVVDKELDLPQRV